MNITFDLETIPCQSEPLKQMIRDKVTHPKAMKVQKTIDAWEAEKRPQAEIEAIEKTSFNPLFGEIIVIGFAFDDDPAIALRRKPGISEQKLLATFWDVVSATLGTSNYIDKWIGHNVAGFDIPFLYNRCVINNVKPVSLPRRPKPWNKQVFDTQYEVMGDNFAGGSLDTISKILGMEGKTEGMDGSQVWPEYQKGNIDKIADYCIDDVNLTRDIYKRLLFIDSVKNDERPDYLK